MGPFRYIVYAFIRVCLGSSHRNKGKNTPLSRKDARKQERLDRKKRRADHFSTAGKRKPEEEHVDVPDSKRRKTDHVKGSTSPQKTRHDSLARSDACKPTTSKSKPTPLEKLASQSTREAPKVAPRITRTREEAEEDAYIAYLETRLGYSNGSRRSNGDEADGLGGGSMYLQCGHRRIETCTQICSTLPMALRSPSWIALATLTPARIATPSWTLGICQMMGSPLRWMEHQTAPSKVARQTTTKSMLTNQMVAMNGLVLARVTTSYLKMIRVSRLKSPRHIRRVSITSHLGAIAITCLQYDTSRLV